MHTAARLAAKLARIARNTSGPDAPRSSTSLAHRQASQRSVSRVRRQCLIVSMASTIPNHIRIRFVVAHSFHFVHKGCLWTGFHAANVHISAITGHAMCDELQEQDLLKLRAVMQDSSHRSCSDVHRFLQQISKLCLIALCSRSAPQAVVLSGRWGIACSATLDVTATRRSICSHRHVPRHLPQAAVWQLRLRFLELADCLVTSRPEHALVHRRWVPAAALFLQQGDRRGGSSTEAWATDRGN